MNTLIIRIDGNLLQLHGEFLDEATMWLRGWGYEVENGATLIEVETDHPEKLLSDLVVVAAVELPGADLHLELR